MPSTYGEQHAVYTGPYMVKGDAQGDVTGFQPQQRINLVRNPQYADVGDFRPAYLDAIDFSSGNDDTARRHAPDPQRRGAWPAATSQPPARQLKRLLQSEQARALRRPRRRLAGDLDRHVAARRSTTSTCARP